ncbi:FmdE family protein [Streptomyces sp. NPDC093225]|uniref:FmdE family protein n=1 Tax=Streptomyces sp. NPDC093225 TaxID=3366034 RepID=UPI003803D35F
MDRHQAYSDVIRFHQHECPGVAFGLRVAEAAMDRLGLEEATGNLVLVSETDACAVDALQVLTGCTSGKRNLIHEDNGRNVFTFWGRGASSGVQVRAAAGSIVFRSEEIWALASRIEDGTATAEDEARFAAAQADRIAKLLTVPDEEILVVEDVTEEAPHTKHVARVDVCVDCGNPTSVETLHEHRGRMVCPACHLAAHGGVLPEGHGDHGHHPHSHKGKHQHGHGHQHDHKH